MLKVLLCMQTQHDWRLVLVAALVCAVGCCATFFLYAKTPNFPQWRRWVWLMMTGVVAGSSIWTTHFVAMIAFKTGLPVGYALGPTVMSLVLAVLSTSLGFAVAGATIAGERKLGLLAAGGLLVGLGITLMHYVGMAGYRTEGALVWDPGYVTASVAIGTVFGVLALLAAPTGARIGRRLIASALLVLGIVGMHFTGMAAVTIVPDASLVPPPSLLSDGVMVVAAVAGTALILMTVLGGVAFDTASRNGNLRRLREALDVMPDGLAFYDASDRLVAWNARYEDLCSGSGKTLFAGMLFADLLQASVVHGVYPDAVGRESAFVAERHAMRRSGDASLTERMATGRWLRVTDRRTDDGGTVSVSVDITEMKRAEAAIIDARDLAEEQARRAEAAEAVAGLGHWRIEVATKTVSGSAGFYRIYGLDREAPLHLRALMLMAHPDDVAASAKRLKKQLAGVHGDDDSITRIIRGDGEVRWLASKSKVELGPDGTAAWVIGTIVDVTEQHLLEEQLRAARTEAEAAVVVKSEFLANMSHELRTPLTSIIGFTGLAASQADMSDLTRTYVGRVREASQALMCTVNDILDFSKLEAGQVAIHPRPTQLSKLCRSTLDLFTPQAGAKDLDLILDDGGEEDLALLIDPDRIRQVLLNFVSNAVKFTAKGGVTLRTRFDGEKLAVEVVDTGAGVPLEKQDRLFRRFSQVDGSLTRAQGGTGLGLAICKGLVEAMGGEIGAESTAGVGSRFWFEIPTRRVETAACAGDDAASAALDRTGLRVLVVDDHPANRQIAGLFLAGIGAEVTEAVDGEDAVAVAAEQPFDVILMDIRMPGLDGPAALRRIREGHGPNEATPAIAFTADADTALADRLVDRGFEGVVSKPLDSGLLIAAVVRATAVHPGAREERFVA